MFTRYRECQWGIQNCEEYTCKICFAGSVGLNHAAQIRPEWGSFEKFPHWVKKKCWPNLLNFGCYLSSKYSPWEHIQQLVIFPTLLSSIWEIKQNHGGLISLLLYLKTHVYTLLFWSFFKNRENRLRGNAIHVQSFC